MTARSIEARRFWDRLPTQYRVRIHWRELGRALHRVGAEVLLFLAVTVGWTFLTLGIGALAGTHARAVYFISAGVFSLSLAGWELLYWIARDGMYALSKRKPRA